MVSTEWRSPHTVKQDARYKIVNGGTANAWGGLDNLKTVDTSNWTYIIKNGTSDYRASPVLYINNFGFNIPSKATIKKIIIEYKVQEQTLKAGIKTKTLKLKTGPSTTDWGVGENKAPSTKWSVKPNWTTETISATPSEWGVDLTPSTVNNSNFGVVLQCVGLSNGHKGYGSWSLPRIAYVRMKIEYTVATEEIIEKSKLKTTASLSANTLDVANENTPVTLSIKYQHLIGANKKYNAGESPNTVVSSNTLRIGDAKRTTYTVPTVQIAEDKSSVTYTKTVNIYPGLLTGTQTITISNDDTTINLAINVINSDDTSEEDISNITSKYEDENQRMLLRSVTFNYNSSKVGGAMYLEGEKIQVKNCKFESNTASSKCKNISLNGSCKDS
ncbi:hypothetical protein [Methanosphaera sp.]